MHDTKAQPSGSSSFCCKCDLLNHVELASIIIIIRSACVDKSGSTMEPQCTTYIMETVFNAGKVSLEYDAFKESLPDVFQMRSSSVLHNFYL